MTTNQGVTGWNVNRTEFGDADRRQGTLQQVARNRWVEDSIVAGERHFEYTELRRDEWSVYLHDSSRDVYLQIDLHTSELNYGTGAAAVVPIYEILDASLRPHGRMVNRVEVGRAQEVSAVLQQVEPDRWREVGTESGTTFHFVETGRDDWSVFLHDPGRDAHLHIDLHTKQVNYGVGSGQRSPLYEVIGASDEVNGRLVNLVEVGAEQVVSGRFAQVGAKEWIETDPSGHEQFRFAESGRDDWSVFLHDGGRDIHIQIDLHTREVRFRQGPAEWQKIYDVVSATDANVPPESTPSARVVTGPTVNRVEFGSSTETTGVLRQVDRTTWVEDSVAEGRDRFWFNERARDEWSVYLHDPARNLSLQIDLHTKQVMIGDGTQVTKPLAGVRVSSDEPNGWLATEVAIKAGGTQRDAYRQVDWTTWVEVDADGEETFEFQQTHRDDWSVYLEDESRGVSLQLNLYTKEVKIGSAGSRSVLYSIASADAGSRSWMLGETITSRSQLTELYGPDKRPIGAAYRTSVSFSPNTRWVEVFATEEVEVRIRGQQHLIDRVRPVRVHPNAGGKVVMTVPAPSLRCPTLCLRTNLMKLGTVHLVTPDVDVHKKIARMKPGEFERNRTQLGVGGDVTAQELTEAQQVVQDLVNSVQYAYNVSPTGVQHDRAVRPANMTRPNFAMDLGGAGVVTHDVDRVDAASQIAAATPFGQAQQTVTFESFLAGGLDVARVSVTTGIAIGGELVGAGVELIDEGAQATLNAGERLVAGDLEGANRALIQGGENAQRILNERGHKIGEIADKGGREVAVIIIETLEGKPRSLEASVDAILVLAKDVIEKVGVLWDNFVSWLSDVIGWDKVLETQRGIQNLMVGGLVQARSQVPVLRAQLGRTMADARALLGAGADPPAARSSEPPTTDPVSEALGQLDAFMDDVLSNLPSADVFAGLPDLPNVARVTGDLGAVAESSGAGLITAIDDAGGSLGAALGSVASDPEKLLTAILDGFRAAALVGIDLVEGVGEALMSMFDELLDFIAAIIDLELPIPVVGELYSAVTGEEKMTIGGLVALLLAIPVTITHRALVGEGPVFSSAAMDLDEQSDKGIGILYSNCHFVMAITSPIQLSKAKTPVADGIGLLVALVAQPCGCPKSRDPWMMNTRSLAKTDILQRPEELARNIWLFQWMLFSTAAWGAVVEHALVPRHGAARFRTQQKILLPGVNCAAGLFQFLFFVQLSAYDDQKYDFLDAAFKLPDSTPARTPSGPPGVRYNPLSNVARRQVQDQLAIWRAQGGRRANDTADAPPERPLLEGTLGTAEVEPAPAYDIDEWATSMRNYHAWADTTHRRTWKTVGNSLDAVPTIVQGLKIGEIPTLIKIAQVLSVVSHATEGGIYLARTVNDELL